MTTLPRKSLSFSVPPSCLGTINPCTESIASGFGLPEDFGIALTGGASPDAVETGRGAAALSQAAEDTAAPSNKTGSQGLLMGNLLLIIKSLGKTRRCKIAIKIGSQALS
jgi:hypothetical protein